ncbi:hypothetical protein SAMN03159341_12264 [Paenibacillus sp. 1_12]|uniref:hypothetical protein n=1 Tax=Paenibacillus sp. 1_12 TaxID=1566278 RepID=UPI0008E82C0B|nr:hypothetical protein [Paenibacillus sp. 1_12]SFM25385.1 hypothetical protein SAMN03159341_12264 [Paenibacillus sp. 1_12]
MNRIMEIFWSMVVILAIILYSWMGLTDLDKVYNTKVILSSLSIVGHQELIEEIPRLNFRALNDRQQKAVLVGLIEMGLSNAKSIESGDSNTKRLLATSFGETDIRYHFKLATGNFVPTTLDLSTNFLYNFTYILNTPAKLVHNLKTNFEMINEPSIAKGTIISKAVSWIFVTWDVMHAIVGVGFAIIMLFFGSIIGLLFHPIQSIVNFLPSLWLMLVSIWHAVANFSNLSK